MKDKIRLLSIALSVLVVSSCVQLPNLLPDGSGENSDMEIIELNAAVNYGGTLTVNEDLTLNFPVEQIVGECAEWFIQIDNGHVLTQNNLHPVALQEGDLVGGIIEGYWKPKTQVKYGIQFFPECVYFPTFEFEEDTIVGIRFKINNKFHYGWMILYADANSNISIKTIGYNKLAGVNVRISN